MRSSSEPEAAEVGLIRRRLSREMSAETVQPTTGRLGLTDGSMMGTAIIPEFIVDLSTKNISSGGTVTVWLDLAPQMRHSLLNALHQRYERLK